MTFTRAFTRLTARRVRPTILLKPICAGDLSVLAISLRAICDRRRGSNLAVALGVARRLLKADFGSFKSLFPFVCGGLKILFLGPYIF